MRPRPTKTSPIRKTWEKNVLEFPYVSLDLGYTINYLRCIQMQPIHGGVHFEDKEDEDGVEALLEMAKHLQEGEKIQVIKSAVEARDPDNTREVEDLIGRLEHGVYP